MISMFFSDTEVLKFCSKCGQPTVSRRTVTPWEPKLWSFPNEYDAYTGDRDMAVLNVVRCPETERFYRRPRWRRWLFGNGHTNAVGRVVVPASEVECYTRLG